MRTLLVVALALLFLPGPACGWQRVGLGVMAGEPTGISLNVWTSTDRAIDAAAGWSIGEDGWLYVHCDYVFHGYEFPGEPAEGSVPYYFGIGSRVLFRDGDDSRIGIRVPFGVNYAFEDGRFDVFLELAPIMDLVPETEFDFGGGIGARYYF
jgi:hypothetical protein